MKTVRDACQLQPSALSVKLSDQIEQLDELISAEVNGTAFFDRTFITQGMKDLITEGIFGSLLDTIEDDWIESVQELEERMDEYIQLRDQAHNAFELRYHETINPDKGRWELCSRVLSRRDIVDRLSAPW
jgi:hypothetical protein